MRFLKLVSYKGTQDMANVWLKILGRLSNSTPLFLKGISRTLLGRLHTDLLRDCVTFILWCQKGALLKMNRFRAICQYKNINEYMHKYTF